MRVGSIRLNAPRLAWRARATTSTRTGDEAPHRRSRRGVWILLAVVTIVGALFIGVYPARTYLSQRSSLHRAQHQIDVLKTQNDKLAEQAQQLNTDSEIERLAREQYNFVRPGEQAFAILPAPPAPIQIPPVWPFTNLAKKLDPSAAANSGSVPGP